MTLWCRDTLEAIVLVLLVLLGVKLGRAQRGADFISYSSSFASNKQTVSIAKRLTFDKMSPAVHTTLHAV